MKFTLSYALWLEFQLSNSPGSGSFQGGAAQALWNHISGHYNCQHSRVYAHYTAIVQSSGMGKSRTVDELGKTHFVIPINLRGSHSTGDVYSLFVSISINLSYFIAFQGFLLLMTTCETF